ncbi:MULTISPECIES: FUSC family protein [unclassified Rhizobium]|uniref:FUSC family protein n=1 Tax=unclassified Rhizobium TaxID=2613769 RepID=UPI001615EAB8|nr:MULTISPECIES: FUSC family protein [unclassified Rhizobium]MBB3541099.1 putative membrane protein YccC [Rhizobium sp. BK399]MCS3743781.1 putative membrane protein YccC [Rhizobium sp. BK661]MCS4096144.1 putative membrane protein YccC [Rhizobium sp. BK176]
MTSSKNATDPSLGDVVFSLKTFTAAMLALGIALCFDLQNPYWAVGTVYIVAHPLSGASTSKALYRLIGTALGGGVTVILIPNLVNSPEMLTLAIALWMAFCLGVSLLHRTPRSYSFMLAGYTTALTGFPIVANPDTAFTYATARVVEIALGIICAAVVNRILFPRHAGPVLAGRINAWLRDGADLAIGTLKGRGRDPALLAAARRLAADAVDLHSFTTHVAYDTSALRDIVGRTRILQQRMVAMLPIVSGLADVLHALERATAGKFTPAITTLIGEVTALLESGKPLAEDKRQQLLVLMTRAEEEGRAQQEWNGLLAHNFTARIRDLVQIWGDCLSLRQDIESGSHHDLRWRRFGTSFDRAPIHKDYGMAIHSGLSVMLATFIATAFWIYTGWPQGSAAAMMAGVLCCIFSSMDDPAPMMIKFVNVAIVTVIAAFVFEYGLMPLIHSYVELAAALGLMLVPAGLLMTKPSLALYGMGFCVNLPNMLTLQDRLNLDLASFVNSNAAMIIGMVIACGTTVLVRSVGAEWTAYRVLRSGWTDIVAAARRPEEIDFTKLLYRMVDRLGLVAPRLAMIPAESAVAQTDIMRDLRNGLNTLDLQRHKQLVSRDKREPIEKVLSGIAAYYQQKQKSRDAQPDENLLTILDQALAALVEAGKSSAIEGARRSMTALRYTLYPDAASLPVVAGAGTAKEHAA